MLVFILMTLVVVVAITLCLYNYSLHRRLKRSHSHDLEFIRKAAEHSMTAGNSLNPIIALIEVIKGIQLLEILHSMYSLDEIYAISGVKSDEMLETLVQQKRKILKDLNNNSENLHIVDPAGKFHTEFEDDPNEGDEEIDAEDSDDDDDDEEPELDEDDFELQH